jgi:hypothetical protein
MELKAKMQEERKSRTIWVLNAIFAFCFASLFATAKYLRFFTQAGDGASYVGLVGSVRKNFKLDPYLYSSILNMNQNAWSGIDYWCSSNFSFSAKSSESVLQWHAYLVAYPFGFLSRLTGVSPAIVVAIAESLAVVLAIIVCAKELGRIGCSRFYIWLIVGVLIGSPILSIGSSGQLQPERLLVLPIVLIFTQMERFLNSERTQNSLVIAAYVFGILISERSAITLFWLTFAYLIMRSPKTFLRPFHNIFLILGAASFCWWIIWTTQFENSIYYNRVSLKSMISGLQFSFTHDASNTIKMLLVLFPLIALSIFRWQGLMLGLISLIPNLAVSVGGAEKTSLITHYHSVYFAVFFGTATLGAIELSKKFNGFNHKLHASKYVLTAALSLLVAYNFSYSESGNINPKLIEVNIKRAMSAYGLNLYSRFGDLNSSRIEMIHYVEDIPVGSSISSPEWTMPALIDQGHLSISYYPLGVANADVIFAEIDGDGQISYLPWLMDHDTASAVGMCVLTAINERNLSYVSKQLRSDLMRIEFPPVSEN